MVALNARYPIAVDFGDGEFCAVQLRMARRKVVIRDFTHGRLPEPANEATGSPDALGACLKEALGRRRFSGRSVALHLPPDSLFTFPMRLELGRGESLDEGILREAAKTLPFPLEEAILDYPSVQPPSGGGDGVHRILLVAVRKETLGRYVVAVRRAGYTPALVDFGFSSLLRLHRHLKGQAKSPFILCCVGRQHSMLGVVTQDSILAYRTIHWGTGALAATLLDNLELSQDEANADFLLREHGLLHDACVSGRADDRAPPSSISRAVCQLVSPLVDSLVHELHNLIAYIRSEQQAANFDKVFMYGLAPTVRDLGPYVASRVNIGSEVAGPVSLFESGNSRTRFEAVDVAPFALVAGLAMRKVPWL